MNRDSASPASASEPVSRTERRRRDAVARVFAAATRLFAERGFAETSMAAIAEAADVSVGTLYNLFDSKDALYIELVRSEAELFRNRLIPALRTGGPIEEVLDRFLETLLDLFRQQARTIRLYWRVSNQARISFRASLGEPIRALYDETVAAFARALLASPAHSQPDPDAHRAAMCCQALTGELFLLHIDDPKKHPADVVLAEAKRIVRAITAPLIARTRSPL
jgi:AcrR family transcriptional regulator